MKKGQTGEEPQGLSGPTGGMPVKKSAPQKGLGTFAGVFTPSILTILGIILFLRLGYVVGSAGLAKSLVIILIANLISVLTSFSLAAIATNMKVKGGGDYYLISRTLGIEFGGAIGIVLFLAQSVSIAFYCMGFGEAVAAITGGHTGYMVQIIAGTAILFLFVLAWIGADLATKFQFVVMVFLCLALASFYAGGVLKWDLKLLSENWIARDAGPNFWILFALFFPAVTGFTQGVSMSGDLENPGKSLPSGTFCAVALSILVYFSVALVFAASSPLSSLAGDYGVMKKTALFGPLIDAGVIAATLSSAMASFLGAPRILQSLASDKIFPFLNFFAKGYGPSGNPRRGVLLSFGIAFLTVLMGQLDLIAGVVSMFFLISYGLLNYATYYEAAAESPSFRPRFQWYDKRISLVGGLVCLCVMLAIDFKTGITAAAVLFAVFQYLKRTAAPARWADSRRSYHLKAIRDNLISAGQDPEHPRDWRPYILALANGSGPMAELLDFSEQIEGKSGMTTAAKMIKATGYQAIRLKTNAKKELKGIISAKGSQAFPLVLSSEYASSGLSVLFQSHGIGPIKVNTVLLNRNDRQEPGDTRQSHHYRQYIRLALLSGCNVIVLDAKPQPEPRDSTARKPTIDVWWKGNDTSRLILLLAYLMTRNEKWEDADIRLLAFNFDRDSEENRNQLIRMLDEIRIPAIPVIVPNAGRRELRTRSGPSDMVFVPVSLRDEVPVVFGDVPVFTVLPELKTVAMVTAAQKIDLDSEPEEGEAAKLALLFDELRHAEKRVQAAEKSAYLAMRSATEFIETAQKDALNDPKAMTHLKEALSLKERSEDAGKKLLKERSKLVQISQQAKDRGLHVETDDE